MAASSMNSSVKMFIYDLPYVPRKQLCRILDQDNKWEELGGKFMGFNYMDLKDMGREVLRNGSPTDSLLTTWGQQNHTVSELFVLLSHMHHYHAMLEIAPYVEEHLHVLISEGEFNMSRPLQDVENRARTVTAASNKVEFDAHNLNVADATQIPDKIVVLPPLSPAEEKIINRPTVDRNAIRGAGALDIPNHHPVSSNTKESVRKDEGASSASTALVDPSGGVPTITYQDLVIATDNWDKRKILGKGGFGIVYRGLWKNTDVAVKRIEPKESVSESEQQLHMQQTIGELRILNTFRHDNILPLYGYSLEGGAPCLVYQYMPNGSLEDCLLCRRKNPPLLWPQRFVIATGIVRGIQFLHSRDKPLIHGDIKSANILLDRNFEPKIGDFGLAREGPQSQYTHMKVSRVHGTRPYLPNEYLRSKKLSTKVDTFSFGIVLFELATGQRAYEEARQKKFLRELVEECEEDNLERIKDSKGGVEDDYVFLALVKIGKYCVKPKAKDRPEMVKVLQQLDAIKKEVLESKRASQISWQPGSSGTPTVAVAPSDMVYQRKSPGSIPLENKMSHLQVGVPSRDTAAGHLTPHASPNPSIPSLPPGYKSVSPCPSPIPSGAPGSAPVPHSTNPFYSPQWVPTSLPVMVQNSPQENGNFLPQNSTPSPEIAIPAVVAFHERQVAEAMPDIPETVTEPSLPLLTLLGVRNDAPINTALNKEPRLFEN